MRADANNLWRDAQVAIDFLAALDLAFMGLAGIGNTLDMAIILDESILRPEQLAALAEDSARWIVNRRISKMAGYCAHWRWPNNYGMQD